MSCLSPTEKFSPFSTTGLSSWPGKLLTLSFMLVRSIACQIASSVYFWNGSKLNLRHGHIVQYNHDAVRFILFYQVTNCNCNYLIVPINSTGSCGMIDSFDRRSSRPISVIFTPSILIKPDVKSTNLNNETPNDDLPDPVLPTIPRRHTINQMCDVSDCFYVIKVPIFSCGSISNETSFKTSGRFGRYRIFTCENWIQPFRGQSAAGRRSLIIGSPSLSKVCAIINHK